MEIVEKQLTAYNNQNLEEFLDCYDDNVLVKMLQTDQTLSEGKKSLGQLIKAAFSNQSQSKSNSVKTIRQGNLVINQEHITGHEDDKLISTISIYELNEEQTKITKLWFGGRETQDL